MRRSLLVATSMALLFAVRPALSNDDDDPKTSDAPRKSGVTVSATGENRASSHADPRSREDKPSADEIAIRKTGETYVKAFASGDAKAAARHFTNDAEYIDPQGIVYEGRQSIEDLLTAFFANNPKSKMQFDIDSLRMVSPGVAVEDGTTTLFTSSEADPVVFQYTAIHVKDAAGKWQTASVRDRLAANPQQHRTQLKQLDWMVGDWVHEGDDALVRFSCHPVDNGKFLERKFTIHVAGEETMSGTQRIGWDAQSNKFRAWVFDSAGGFSDGCWHRNGNDWVLKMTGITPDGKAASSTSIYSFVDARTMTFQSVDHEVGGIQLPDSAPVTIVRQAPSAEAAE